MTHPPVTYHDLVRGLQQLGVMRGAMIEVHSSLSRFGWVEGGAPGGDLIGPSLPGVSCSSRRSTARTMGRLIGSIPFPEDPGSAN
jgi:hypothetical protein